MKTTNLFRFSSLPFSLLTKYSRPLLLLWISVLLFSLPFSPAHGQAGLPTSQEDCEQLNGWMTMLEIDDTQLYHPDWTREIYKEQGCQPLWYNPVTTFIFTNEIISILQNAEVKNDYHLEKIESLYEEIQRQLSPFGLFDFNSLSDLDILLTDAALHYAFNIQDKIGEKTVGANKFDEETERFLLIDGLQNALRSESLGVYFEELREGVDDLEVSSFEEEPYTEDALEEVEAEEEREKLEEETVETPIEEETTDMDVETESNQPAAPIISAVQDSSIYVWVQKVSTPASKSIFKQGLSHPAWVDSFYRNRNYAPVWHNGYTLYGRASEAILQIENAAKEGLKATDYHGKTLTKLHQQINEVYDAQFMPYDDFLPQIDLLITDAVLHYAHHLRHGRLNPDKIDIGWNIRKDGETDLAVALQKSLSEPEQGIQFFFDNSRPQHEEYKQLMTALTYYQNLLTEKGSWGTGLKSGKLEVGMEDKAVAKLRERLFFEEELPKTLNDVKETTIEVLKSEVNMDTLRSSFAKIVTLKDSLILTQIDSLHNPAIFDSVVFHKLVAFQRQHGIADDGVIGSNTLSVLNISLQHRIQQIEVALEQWRWMPNEYSDFFVFVNIPAYQLDVYKKGKIDLTKKVMVGKTIFKTVIFNNYIRYLELNPYWNVPRSIATKEILPKLKRNLSYLNRQDMKILSGGKVINPYNVNWSRLSRRNFPYRIRQEPGKKNALGTVKFMFPNHYNIYLHDTPSKSLFVKAERAYSHGCIRLDKPVQFAEYLLQDDPKWDAKKIQKVLDGKKNTRVNLEEKIPIYIAYFTAWVDDEGVTHFQKDVYGKDKEIMKVL